MLFVNLILQIKGNENNFIDDSCIVFRLFLHLYSTLVFLPFCFLFLFQQNYLMKFGYLPQSDLETGNLRTDDQLTDAIKNLQVNEIF